MPDAAWQCNPPCAPAWYASWRSRKGLGMSVAQHVVSTASTLQVSTSCCVNAAEPVRQDKKDAGGWGSTRVADLLRSKVRY